MSTSVMSLAVSTSQVHLSSINIKRQVFHVLKAKFCILFCFLITCFLWSKIWWGARSTRMLVQVTVTIFMSSPHLISSKCPLDFKRVPSASTEAFLCINRGPSFLRNKNFPNNCLTFPSTVFEILEQLCVLSLVYCLFTQNKV